MAKITAPKKNKAVARAAKRAPKPALPELTECGVEETDETGDGLFPIAGIGASAGGLEAFTELLQNLPPDTGMGFIFVQHLDPKHVSLLTDLLQRQTSMGVQEAIHGVTVQPNQVYVIPRNSHMSLVRGVLTLTPRQGSPLPHMPIDPFLRSLAAERKSKAIGVILSGNASDGALGMMAIKSAGGITFAQTRESAKYDGMPRSAVAAGCVDFVLAPAQIAKELARLGRHPYIVPSPKPAKDESQPAATQAFTKVLVLLRNSTGVDFSYYKSTSIRRRILRRMALRQESSLDRYVAKLRADAAELKALYEDILINVTEFFRDPAVFERLKKVVFPKILPKSGNSGPIRVWVAGCSSGEEVYSIGMALLEFLEDRNLNVNIQIFGTDISENALEKARNGVYSSSGIHDVSPERLRRFFTKVDSNFQVSKRLREMCVFAKQNLVKDPPFSKLDLISCRNVLIYFGPVLQKRIIPIFHYALKPNGFLLLGASETIGSFSELFTLRDKKAKICSKNPSSRRVPMEMTMEDAEREKPIAQQRADDWSDAELGREADRIVLGRYAPSGVVIDDDLNILQFRGHVTAYLEPSPGIASLNLQKMAREGLAAELRSAVQTVRRQNAPVRREGLHIRRDSGLVNLNFEVVPFKKMLGKKRRYLILFEEAPEPAPRARKSGKRLNITAANRESTGLRQELAATKEYLRSISEEHESANEELRAANEEIQSSNEELQSTNEELETAKEELQSTNEELNTVNEELHIRNLQLDQAGNDLLNLFSNVNMPIVMLSNDLRIRRFTPVSQRVLNLIPSDVGRPISDINLNLEITKLDPLLTEVMETLAPKTIETKDLNGRLYSLRIRPYRTEDNRIDGIVMVLVDLEHSQADPDLVAGAMSQIADMEPSELRAFSAGLLIAQEKERQNLSRELHDDLSQRLALLELNVETLERTPPPPDQLPNHLRSFHHQITALSEDMRHIAHRLHPAVLDDLGLAVAIESYIRDFKERENIEVSFQRDNIPGVVDPGAALCLYRILQESLRNVAKHSSARSVQVSLIGKDGKLYLTVKDSGNGFDVAAVKGHGGLGLRSMKERARLAGGTFQIRSLATGTEVTVEVPQEIAAVKQLSARK